MEGNFNKQKVVELTNLVFKESSLQFYKNTQHNLLKLISLYDFLSSRFCLKEDTAFLKLVTDFDKKNLTLDQKLQIIDRLVILINLLNEKSFLKKFDYEEFVLYEYAKREIFFFKVNFVEITEKFIFHLKCIYDERFRYLRIYNNNHLIGRKELRNNQYCDVDVFCFWDEKKNVKKLKIDVIAISEEKFIKQVCNVVEEVIEKYEIRNIKLIFST